MQQANLRLDHKRIEFGRSMTWTRQLPGARFSSIRANVEVKSEVRNTFVGETKIETKTRGVIASPDIEPFKIGEGSADNVTKHAGRADARM